MFCPQCKTKTLRNVKYCLSCGEKLIKKETSNNLKYKWQVNTIIYEDNSKETF